MINKNYIIDAFNFRAAIKEFDKEKKISESDFNYIIEAGKLSPSSFGIEPWKILLIENKEFKTKLSEIAWGAKKQLETSSHFIIILARTIKDLKYDTKYMKNHMIYTKKIPEEIYHERKMILEKFQKNDFNLLENERTIFDWACKQTYIMLGNMMTAAALMGIDSCPIEGFEFRKVENLLDEYSLLEKGRFSISVMAAFGYRKFEPRKKTRKKLEEIFERVV